MFFEALWRCLIHTAVGLIRYFHLSVLVCWERSCCMYLTSRGRCVPVHAVKTHGGVEVQLRPFLTSALNGVEWLASRSYGLNPFERSARTPSGRFDGNVNLQPLSEIRSQCHGSSPHSLVTIVNTSRLPVVGFVWFRTGRRGFCFCMP